MAHMQDTSIHARATGIDSAYAWVRLLVTLLIGAIGSVGMWSGVVVLPAVQTEFGVARGDASLPFTLTMVCYGLGGIVMGRWADRLGVVRPIILGTLLLAIGYGVAGYASTLWLFAVAHGFLIGFGCSAMFGPLIADISHWFQRRRGLAVAIGASGNYLAGTVWPPIVERMTAAYGWRWTYYVIGLVIFAAILPLTLALRRRSPVGHELPAGTQVAAPRFIPDISPNALQTLLILAGIACCVAMSMPQVHMVAYCADLGYGPARGAEMLSLMLGCGIISRLASGWVADRIGGFPTLLLGTVLQTVALVLYIPFDGLVSLYVISALFGLFQGGIVPSYAIIVRECFSPREAGARVGTVLMSTLVGMALGGWLSGVIFDYTGSYQAAFLHGILWNVANILIVLWLMHRPRRQAAYA
jgi:MFS family permease